MSGNVALALLVLGVIYLGACRVSPLKACRHCDGGKIYSSGGKTWRRCKRCGGTGEVERWGAKIGRNR